VSGKTELPKGWHTMSLPALYEALQRSRPTAQSTIDAVCHAVKTRGLDALQEPDTLERLARCDRAAKQQIDQRIERMLKGKAL
jgi:hypothetical protein